MADTLSWGRPASEFIPEARKLAERIWQQILATPDALRRVYGQQPALGGSGMMGVQGTMTQGARGVRELKNQMDFLGGKSKRVPSIADLAR